MPWTPWAAAAGAAAETVDGVAGEAIDLGEACYLSAGAGTTAGKIYLADVDLAYASTLGAVLGLCTSAAAADGDAVTIQTGGLVEVGVAGLSSAKVYGLSATPGALALTASAPWMGIAESATSIRLSGAYTTSGLTAGTAYGSNGSGVITSGLAESVGYAVSTTELQLRARFGATKPASTQWTGPAPLLYFRFDADTGATATDSSGNALSGTFRNVATPSYLASQTIGTRTATVLDYTPASNGGMFLPTLPTVTAATGTIAAWINPDTINDSEYLATLGATGGAITGYFYFSGSKMTAWPVQSSANVTVGSWEHWTWVRDGTAYKIYKNGAVSPDGASGTGASFVRDDDDVEFLCTYVNRSAALQYEGLVSDLTMWDEALTDAQVLELYNSGTPLTLV